MLAVTFYTTLCNKPGYPVLYCAPSLDDQKRVIYKEVQVFTIEDHPFHDPADACGEFEAWCEPREYRYLHEKQFHAKIKALRQVLYDEEKKLASWNAMARRQIC